MALVHVDELNATLGIVISNMKVKHKKVLQNIQNDLFDIGADLATPFNKRKNAIRIKAEQILHIEKEIDKIATISG